MTSPSKIALYARTVARMRPGMVVSRLRRTRLVADAEVAGERPMRALPVAMPEVDCCPEHAARFDADALSRGEFLLINERRAVDLSAWSAPEASHPWNFNLHYFEHCVPLAARHSREGDPADYEAFRRLVTSWVEANPYPGGDAWHPYTISLRLVNWLVCADLFGGAYAGDAPFRALLEASAYRQYRHLLVNQETHLRANHWFENLKTLLVCACAFGERDVYDRARRDFEAQLAEQVLPDGVHFERSVMYHELVLEGLLRVALAADAAGWPRPAGLDARARAMLGAMCSLARGMGRTPAFNDSSDGVAKPAAALAAAAGRVLGAPADDC